jgi:DNA-binding LytR/AlgR family response regulator
MLDRLDPQLFVRVHRSLIINRAEIRSVRRSATGSYCLVTNDGSELAVGRSFRQRVREIVRASAGP